MDTQRDSDLLEQHNTQHVVAMPRDTALGSFQQAPSEDPASSCPAEVVPRPPVARTGFQASLRPYSSGQG
eukprot:5941152-Amphidinium_carterae.1